MQLWNTDRRKFPPLNSNIGSFQTVPTSTPPAWRWCKFPYACKYLSTVTLKRAGEPCIGTKATTVFSCGSGSQHRFHIPTLIPCLLTHCTTGCVKSSWLCSLNRGIIADQTEIGQQKTTCTRLKPVEAVRYCSAYVHPDISVFLHLSGAVKTAKNT